MDSSISLSACLRSTYDCAGRFSFDRLYIKRSKTFNLSVCRLTVCRCARCIIISYICRRGKLVQGIRSNSGRFILKNSTMAEVDNLTAVLYGIEDIRLVRTQNDFHSLIRQQKKITFFFLMFFS